VFHIQDVLLPTHSQGWWVIHDELAQLQHDTIGLRFDLTNTMASVNLQGATITGLQSTYTSIGSSTAATGVVARSALS
jgi:hypothetical protein